MKSCNRASRRSTALALLMAVGCCGADPALAQEDDGQTTVLEPIVVTARKQEEAEKDVPISILVLPRETIEKDAIDTLKDISRFDPSLNVFASPQGRFSQVNIRGVGSLLPGGYEDGSVSAYVDGVPVPFHMLDGAYRDLERIEVLRGPQGTLYGKNAQAGAINITTVQPTEEFSGDIGVDVGTDGKRELSGSIGGALIPDTLRGRLFFDLDTRDGLIAKPLLGEGPGDIEQGYVRGVLSGTFGDLNATLSLAYDKSRNEDINTALVTDPWNAEFPFDTYEDRETFSTGLNMQYEINDAITLHSITGFHTTDWEYRFAQASDRSTFNDDGEAGFSQEVRLDGNHDNGVMWTAGLFAQKWRYDIDMTSSGLLEYHDTGRHTGTTFAGFGEVTVPLAERLKLSVGARLAYDRRSVDETLDNISYGMSFDQVEDKSYTGWSGRTALSYNLTDDHMVYASLARGYKPGGFQTNHVNGIFGIDEPTDGFESSSSLAYELGYKGQFLDGRLSLDATLFWTDTKDEQIPSFDPMTFHSLYVNEDTRSRGVELAMRWQATEAFQFGGAVTLLNAELTGGSGLYPAGVTLPNSPKTKFTVFGEYRDQVDMLGATMPWFVRGTAAYTGARWADLDHTMEFDGFTDVGLQAGIERGDFSASVYAENLLDEEYIAYGGYGRVYPGEGRRVGLRTRLKF